VILLTPQQGSPIGGGYFGEDVDSSHPEKPRSRKGRGSMESGTVVYGGVRHIDSGQAVLPALGAELLRVSRIARELDRVTCLNCGRKAKHAVVVELPDLNGQPTKVLVAWCEEHYEEAQRRGRAIEEPCAVCQNEECYFCRYGEEYDDESEENRL
jgi:hypothetical protein